MTSAPDQKAAALYLLKLRQSSHSFQGFMAYYYDFSWEDFHVEMQEVLDLLEKDALLSAGGNPVRNILLTLPPRHAKSFNATINFPAYALMKKAHRELMISSYNNELAATFGRGTRDIVTDPKARKAFGKFELSRDTRAVDFWKTTSGGAYYAVGLNGTTTGRGVNCLVGETVLLVMTGRGAIYKTTMTSLFTDDEASYVLAYDHATNSPSWGRINARSKTKASELFEIRCDDGSVLEATGEHPIYAIGRGYIEAQDIAPGDVLMRLLPDDEYQASVRGSEVNQEGAHSDVLLPEMQHHPSRDEEHSTLPHMRRASEAKQGPEILQRKVQEGSPVAERGDTQPPVQTMSDALHIEDARDTVLLHELQKYAPFAIHDDGRKSTIHQRVLWRPEAATHHQSVYPSEAEDQGEGWDGVRSLQEPEAIACASHRPQPVQLYLGEPSDAVRLVSPAAPCLRAQDREVTVSMVARVRRECLVYNLSVEGFENYFANGILTHNCLFVDDPYKSREEADSTSQRRKVWDFYTSGLLSRMQPDKDGQPAFQVVTQTRWHPDDMAGRIMESKEFKAGEWVHLNFQALTKKDRGVYVRRNSLPEDDPRYVPNVTVEQMNTGQRTEEEPLGMLSGRMVNPLVNVGEEYTALWPNRFSVDWLIKQKSLLGARDFESLYQQNPYVLGGNLVKEAWFKRYNIDTLPETFHALVIGVDTAFKAKTVNDYSVFTVGAVTESGDIYVLKVFRDKLEFPDLKRKSISINATYRGQGLRGMWIEDNASGQSLIQELRNGSGVAVIPWKPGSADKVLRMTSVTPLIEGGRVFIPDEAEWLEDWLAELVSFPAVKNDDQADSFVIIMDVLSRMVVTGMKEFSSPIGDIMKGNGMKDLLFAGQLMTADPLGWEGAGNGFGKAAGGVSWSGWGNL
jgi:predicted phage terminase large subunit-like protein